MSRTGWEYLFLYPKTNPIQIPGHCLQQVYPAVLLPIRFNEGPTNPMPYRPGTIVIILPDTPLLAGSPT